MDFSIKKAQPESVKTACVVVPAFRNNKLSEAAKRIDRHTRGQLARALKNSEFDGAPGTTLMLFDVTGVGAARVLIIGAGKNGELDVAGFRKLVQAVMRRLCDSGIGDATLFVSEVQVSGRDEQWIATQIAALAIDAAYAPAAAFFAGGVRTVLDALVFLTEWAAALPGVSLWTTKGSVCGALARPRGR